MPADKELTALDYLGFFDSGVGAAILGISSASLNYTAKIYEISKYNAEHTVKTEDLLVKQNAILEKILKILEEK